jgi:hypothetical protein
MLATDACAFGCVCGDQCCAALHHTLPAAVHHALAMTVWLLLQDDCASGCVIGQGAVISFVLRFYYTLLAALHCACVM